MSLTHPSHFATIEYALQIAKALVVINASKIGCNRDGAPVNRLTGSNIWRLYWLKITGAYVGTRSPKLGAGSNSGYSKPKFGEPVHRVQVLRRVLRMESIEPMSRLTGTGSNNWANENRLNTCTGSPNFGLL